MTDALVLILVAAVAAIGGGMGGGLVAALALRREEKRFDARLVPVVNALEDFEDRLVSWQRKALKRDRDALRAPRTNDQEPAQGGLPTDRDSRTRAIRQRALALGVGHRVS